MEPNRRLQMLKVAAAACVGLLAVNALILDPALKSWSAQSDRIRLLRQKVEQGAQLLAREAALRERWAFLQRTDLPEDVAEAESEVFKAVGRWGRDGRMTFTALSPQWHTYEEGYVTLECRANATGDQAGIARFLYELENDPLAVRLESCEITANDKEGRRLLLGARFSALRFTAPREVAR